MTFNKWIKLQSVLAEQRKVLAEQRKAEEMRLQRNLEKDRLDFEQEKFEKEFEENKRTKDRADVSLKEYMALVSENERLKKDLHEAREFVCKIVKPLMELEDGKGHSILSEETIQKMLHNDFKVKADVYSTPLDCDVQVAVIYHIGMKGHR